MLHTLTGPYITLQVVTVTFEAAHEVDPVRPTLEGFQHVDYVDPARAGNLHDFYIRRIRKPHRTCQVRCGVPSELAAEGYDLRLKPVHLFSFMISLHLLFRIM